MIGQTVSRYRIEEKLGEGGMGVVYRAYDPRLGRMVALKMLKPELAIMPDLRRRLETEARAASALNHPAIATLFDFETDDHRSFLVYEFIKGQTLRSIQRDRPCRIDETLSIFISIAEGVAAAHKSGIIHRDLKPENVMRSDESRIKILDFGLAKISAPSREQSTLPTATGAGFLLGTVPYMSPEQLEGETTDFRTDIFSLGTMLYEFASGRHPFAGKSPTSTVSNILKEDPPHLSQFAPAVPIELERITRKCLRKKRDERYQSVHEIAADLQAVRREPAGSAASVLTPGAVDDELAMSQTTARVLYTLVQCLYLGTYAAAIWYSGRIGDILHDLFGLPATTSGIVAGVAASGMLGLRVYLFFPVFLNLRAAARLFRQVFPVLLILDAIWAASPLLLFPKIGLLSLICVVLMTPLPFSQRTLMRNAYPAARTSVLERKS